MTRLVASEYCLARMDLLDLFKRPEGKMLGFKRDFFAGWRVENDCCLLQYCRRPSNPTDSVATNTSRPLAAP